MGDPADIFRRLPPQVPRNPSGFGNDVDAEAARRLFGQPVPPAQPPPDPLYGNQRTGADMERTQQNQDSVAAVNARLREIENGVRRGALAPGAPIPSGPGVFLGQPQAGQPGPAGTPMTPEQAVMQNTPATAVAADARAAAMAELMRRGGGGGPRVRNTITETTAGPVDPNTLAAIGANGERVDAALGARSATLEGGLRDQSGIIGDAAQQSQQQAQEQQAAAQEHAQAMARRAQRADEVNQQVLDGKIDPNRVLGDSFSGGRIAAAIGLLFSGLANGQGGADAFLGQINQTIDRDIAAQESNMANLRAGAQNQQNLVSLYRQIYQDEDAAKQAARATLLQSVAQRLQAQQARMGADMTPRELELVRAQIEQQALQASAAAQSARLSNVRTTVNASGGGSSGPRVAVANAFNAIANGAANAADADADRARGAGGGGPAAYWQANARPGFTVANPDRPAPTSANQVNDALGRVDKIESVMGRLQDARAQRLELRRNIREGNREGATRNLAELERLRAEAAPIIGVALGQGDIGNRPENYQRLTGVSGDLEVQRTILEGGGISAENDARDPVVRDIDGVIERLRRDQDRGLEIANLRRSGQAGRPPTPVD